MFFACLFVCVFINGTYFLNLESVYLSSMLESLILLSWCPSGPGTMVLLLDVVPGKSQTFNLKMTVKM